VSDQDVVVDSVKAANRSEVGNCVKGSLIATVQERIADYVTAIAVLAVLVLERRLSRLHNPAGQQPFS